MTNPVTQAVYKASPGALPGVHALGFVPASHEFSLVPKAVPEEDTQFQADAKIAAEAHPRGESRRRHRRGGPQHGRQLRRTAWRQHASGHRSAGADRIPWAIAAIRSAVPQSAIPGPTAPTTGRAGAPSGNLPASRSLIASATASVSARTSARSCARSSAAEPLAACCVSLRRCPPRWHHCCARAPGRTTAGNWRTAPGSSACITAGRTRLFSRSTS